MSLRPDLICPVRPGEVIAAKFRVERVLGGGAMGIVVAARHLELDRRVAIKLVRPGVLDSLSAVQRLIVEAKAIARLRSEHVPQVFDIGKLDDGCPFIAMEYLRGMNLGSHLARFGKLEPPVAVNYVLQACVAVAEAHARGIVHRDIKPQNLFLTTGLDGEDLIKVLDFGISKFVEANGSVSSDHSLTGTQMTLGSPRYASPEQFGNARHVDARSDIWGLGVTLYELATGVVPFDGKGPRGFMRSLLASPHGVASSSPGGIGPELAAVIDRCLRLAPEERFQSVSDLALALVPFGTPGSDDIASRVRHVARATARVPVSVPAAPRVEASADTVDAPFMVGGSPAFRAPKATADGGSVDCARGPSDPSAALRHTPAAQTLLARYSAAELGRADSGRTRMQAVAVLAAIAAFAAVGVASLVRHSRHAMPGDPLGSSRSSAGDRRSSVARSSSGDTRIVRFEVVASPQQAKLYLDGQALPGNPYRVDVSADEREHRVHAEAEGFAAEDRTVGFARDASIAISMKAAAHRDPVRRRAGDGGASNPLARASASPSTDCTPPFTLDEHGIKRFKPDCL